MMMLTVIDEYDDDDDEYDSDDAYSNDDDNWLLTTRICWYYTIASNLNIRYFDIKFYKVSRDDLHVNLQYPRQQSRGSRHVAFSLTIKICDYVSTCPNSF